MVRRVLEQKVALIKTWSTGRSLAHCAEVARAYHVTLAFDCMNAFQTARPHLDRVPQIWKLGADCAGSDVDAALAALNLRPMSSRECGE